MSTKRLDELRKQRQAKLDAANAICVAAETANRLLTADETAAFDAAHAEATALRDTITRYEQQEAAVASQAAAIRPFTADPDTGGNSVPPRTEPNATFASRYREFAQARRYGACKVFTRERFGEFAEPMAYRTGMWARAKYFGDNAAARYCRENGIGEYGAALSSTDDTAGGTLIPDELSTAILVFREAYGVFRREAMTWPMASDVLVINRKTGTVTTYFVGEATTITASNPTLDVVQLVAKKLGALVTVPRELAADAIINIGDWIAQEFAYAFALKEDQCGFIGDGTSTYGGIRGLFTRIDDGTHTASIFTAATGHTAFSTLTLPDFNGIIGALPVYARPNAKWYVSAVGYANSMERLKYAGGGNASDNISAGTAPSFMGFPVVLVQVANTTTAAQASTVVLALGDLRMSSAMGIRAGLTVDTSEHRYFETDQVGIRAIERFDINNHSLGDTSTAGPIIALKTPAS